MATDSRLLAYFDTFNGPIPCKIVEYDGTETVTVQLTATRGAFKRGELITRPLRSIVSRATRIRSGYIMVHTADHAAAREALNS